MRASLLLGRGAHATDAKLSEGGALIRASLVWLLSSLPLPPECRDGMQFYTPVAVSSSQTWVLRHRAEAAVSEAGGSGRES